MLQDAGVLVTLKLTGWTARKLDKKASEEVCTTHGADLSSGRFNKQIIGAGYLKPINQLINEIRHYHYANTLAWSHKGQDYLPSRHYFTYMDKMGLYEDRFNRAADKFAAEYPKMVQDAILSLKSLHDAADYPSAETVRSKFFMNVSVIPVPGAGDFRVDLGNKEMKRIKEQLDKQTKIAEQAVMEDLFSRLYTTLAKAVVVLATPGKIFRNTMIFNIEDMAQKVQTMDISDNDALKQVCTDIEKFCKKIDINALRDVDDTEYRTQTGNVLKEMMDIVENLYESSGADNKS